MTLFHIDTDYFVHALVQVGPEKSRLLELSDEGATVQISAVAWYELCRGPRTPAQLAVALSVLSENGVVPLDAAIAEHAADVFRRLGSPRKRAQDIAIGVTAKVHGATLLTRNARDFRGIDGLTVEEPRSVAEPR